MTGTNSMFTPAQVDTDLALARRRAFAEVLSLLADLEGKPTAHVHRALVDAARRECAGPDVGRELAACRQRLDDLLGALVDVEARLAAVTDRR